MSVRMAQFVVHRETHLFWHEGEDGIMEDQAFIITCQKVQCPDIVDNMKLHRIDQKGGLFWEDLLGIANEFKEKSDHI